MAHLYAQGDRDRSGSTPSKSSVHKNGDFKIHILEAYHVWSAAASTVSLPVLVNSTPNIWKLCLRESGPKAQCNQRMNLHG